MQLYNRAVGELQEHGVGELQNSFSILFTQSGMSKYIADAIAWKQWIYGSHVSVTFPDRMPTPEDISPMEHADATDLVAETGRTRYQVAKIAMWTELAATMTLRRVLFRMGDMEISPSSGAK